MPPGAGTNNERAVPKPSLFCNPTAMAPAIATPGGLSVAEGGMAHRSAREPDPLRNTGHRAGVDN
jgi:hypothetical protein